MTTLQEISLAQAWELRRTAAGGHLAPGQEQRPEDFTGHHYALFVDEAPVCSVSTFTVGDRWWFRRLATDPAHRHQGHATALVRFVAEQARLEGAQALCCNAYADVRAFYTRLGFVETGARFQLEQREVIVLERPLRQTELDVELPVELETITPGTLRARLEAGGKFSRFSPLYPFTTETIAGYFAHFTQPRRAVLTLAGSGDHVLNALHAGAERVFAFDLNACTLFFTDLKLAALRTLSFDDFVGFFALESPQAFARHTRDLLRTHLDAPGVAFWDRLLLAFADDGRALRTSALFNDAFDDAPTRRASNVYLRSAADYERARTQLQRATVRCVQCPADELAARLPAHLRFDLVLLSNLADYAADLDAFAHALLEPVLRQHLAPGGVACAAYVYDKPHDAAHQRKPIADPARRRHAFGTLGLDSTEVTFSSARVGHTDGMVLLLNRPSTPAVTR